MEKNLVKYIWTYSKRQQLTVLAITMAFFPILYLTLELPKWIINDALSNSSLPKFLFGQQLTPVMYLGLLCVMLLALVIANGVIKMRLNTYKGVIGERLVRRLRYSLIQNTMRFPMPYYSRVSSGELISTVTAETEPLGGYIGEALALPVFQGGTMITILIFMFMQDWVFGLISVALIPVQGYLIPKLQQQVNQLKKERVRQVRKLSERIGETVSGATEIRLHGTQPYTLSEYSRRLGDLFWVRLEIFRKKYFMKFLNNTIGQITPFLFYLFGGYLVIKGDLTIGALVAAIGAYKDLTNPWRELLNFYQLHEDSRVKYQQIIELFNPEGLVEVDETETVDDPIPLHGNIKMNSVSWRNENSEPVLSGVSLDVAAGSMIAITGDYSVRRAALARILACIEQPFSGSYLIDKKPAGQIPDSILHRRLALQSPDPHMFVGTVIENMEYGLMQHEPEHSDDKEVQASIREAYAAGNRAPLDTGWLDYRQAGLPSRERSQEWLGRVLEATGSSKIVAERRILEVFDPVQKPELAENLLVARKEIRRRLQSHDEAAYITLFNPGEFNPKASIAENIMFGVAVDSRLNNAAFDVHPYFLEVIAHQGLSLHVLDVGLNVARYLIKTLDNKTLSTDVLEHFGLGDEDMVERLKSTLDRFMSGTRLSDECNCLLASLYLLLIPERHGFVRFDNREAVQIVQARREFRQNLPEDLQDAVNYFDENQYHPNLTVKDNLLFGRMSSGNPASERVINRLVEDVINEFDLAGDLSLLLGESQVGISGSRLPLVGKHRISLGRSLMKRPGILIFHDALSPLDAVEQRRIRNDIRELLPDSTIIWISTEVDYHQDFDQVFAFTEPGPLVEVGKAGAVPAPELVAKRSTNPMDLIANSILFTELAPDHQRYIADHSQLVSIRADKCIYEAGDNADSAWLVVSGEVETTRPTDESNIVVGRFKRPEVFGALDVMADCPRMMNANTKTDSVLLRIDASAIESVALSDAQVSRTLLRSLSNQWRN